MFEYVLAAVGIIYSCVAIFVALRLQGESIAENHDTSVSVYILTGIIWPLFGLMYLYDKFRKVK